MSENIYIIFIDKDMKGYLPSEKHAMESIQNEAKKIIESKRKEMREKGRVFLEETENGIRIYTQTLGVYLNGAVYPLHTLHWEKLGRMNEVNGSDVSVNELEVNPNNDVESNM